MRNDLYFFRKIRNFYAHHPNADKRLKLTDTFKSDFLALCKKFTAELSEIVIPESDIFKQKLSDPIGPAIKVMKERVFTHIPIMTGNKVWGVFSECTLFDLAGKGNISKINESTRFVDFGSSITYRKTGVYDFVDSNATLDDIRRIFYDEISKRRKLEVLFITSTGTKDGNLLGMITVWDIATL
jgi:predicted transcriptional regulator